MTHPILALQAALVAALRDVPDFAVFDAPRAGRKPPYVTIARHDLLPRDGDDAPGWEHRVLFHAWAADASRKAAVTMAETIGETVLGDAVQPEGLVVTLRRHDRTDTAIDAGTGRARAVVAFTFFTEGM